MYFLRKPAKWEMPLGPKVKSKKNGTKKICVNGFIFE
jgi:hypothetical protein